MRYASLLKKHFGMYDVSPAQKGFFVRMKTNKTVASVKEYHYDEVICFIISMKIDESLNFAATGSLPYRYGLAVMIRRFHRLDPGFLPFTNDKLSFLKIHLDVINLI